MNSVSGRIKMPSEVLNFSLSKPQTLKDTSVTFYKDSAFDSFEELRLPKTQTYSYASTPTNPWHPHTKFHRIVVTLFQHLVVPYAHTGDTVVWFSEHISAEICDIMFNYSGYFEMMLILSSFF